MNIADKKVFYAKILLLGEYSIMLGGQALSIPLKRFSGHFDYFSENSANREFASSSHDALQQYFHYLKGLVSSKQLQYPIDVTTMESDLSLGMYFNSNIPQGYGAGSSGALVAAIFSHYALHGLEAEEWMTGVPIDAFRQQLAIMESFFHGSSSGLDPLSSLTGKPFVLDAENKIRFLKPNLNAGDPRFTSFLLDTAIAGKTKPLVDWFKKEVAQNRLNAKLLKDLSDEALKAFLDKDAWLFWNYLSQLSLFQLTNMQPMIPQIIHDVWENGLQKQSYILKLCGSGGGGYILGFTRDFQQTKDMFETLGFNLIVL